MKLNDTIYFIILSIICTIAPLQTMYGQGSRYAGDYKKSGPVNYYNKNNFIIEGLEIDNAPGNAISLTNCENVIIRYNKVTNSGLKPAIYVFNSKNVTIIDNTLENVQSGLVASTSQGIKFEYNDVLNILGSLRGGSRIGVMAQFINVYGSGNSISYNANENHSGKSSTEDIINVFNSNGTANSPIRIKGNWIRGGGPSGSGGGINIGDHGGSHQVIEENILVNPGQYGVATSGGSNMTISNNKVYQKRDAFTNVGIIACNWTENTGLSKNIKVENNIVNYTHRDGYANSWWLYKNMEPIAGKSTNISDKKMTDSILPYQIIGRARSGGSSSNNPDSNTPANENNKPEQPGNSENKDQQPNKPDFLPNVKNDPSISIYLDQYKRVCVNVTNRTSSAMVVAADSKGNIIYQNALLSYHTVLPNAPIGGTYYVYVKNGNKEHLKQLQIIK